MNMAKGMKRKHIILEKEINKKIKNVKYKNEETKSEFQKKKKTYIDQIEEQQHAIKSQIISKK